MARRLVNFLTALSLALCVAGMALWVRSHFVQDDINVQRSRSDAVRSYSTDHDVYSVAGQLIWKIATRDRPQEFEAMVRRSKPNDEPKRFSYRRRPTDEFSFNPAGRGYPPWVRCGFRYSHSVHTSTGPAVAELMTALHVKPEQSVMTTTFTEVGVPHWLLPAATAPLPLFMAHRWRRRRRRTHVGLCPR